MLGKKWYRGMLIGRKEILEVSLNQKDRENLKMFKYKKRLERKLNLHGGVKYVCRPSQENHILVWF